MTKHNRRDKLANKLLSEGRASIRDILTASYGEWPPKGLDIDPSVTHEKRIKFELFDKDYTLSSGYRVSGWVYLGGDRINLNEALENFGTLRSKTGEPVNLNTVMGHEAVHIIQGERIPDRWAFYSTEANRMAYAASTQGDVFRVPKGELRRSFSKPARKYLSRHADYFGRGIEIQARLHQVMAEGYQQWGRLPQNRDELWMAFSNFGFKPPPEISFSLKMQSIIDPSLADFKASKKIDNMAVSGLQVAYDMLLSEGKETFWHETLPGLYGDLIQMYGDRQGRARFDLGHDSKVRERTKSTPALAVSGKSL